MFKRLGRAYARYAVLCFGAFFVYALYFNIFGTNAAQMMAYFGTDSVGQGLIISVQAAGGIAVAVLFTLFGERFHKIRVIWRGLFVLGAASAAIGIVPLLTGPAGGYAAVLMFGAAAGCGFTMVDVMMNASVPEVFPTERDAVFPLVHASYSVGSMVSPVMTSLLIAAAAPKTYALPFAVCAALCLVLFVSFRSAALKIMPPAPAAPKGASQKIAWSDFAVLKRGRLWLFFLSGVFYFSFQITVSAWFPSYAVRDLGLTNAAGGLGVSLFFGMSLIARVTAPFIYRFMSVRRYYIVLGGLGGLIYLAAYATQSPAAVFIAMVLGGYCQGVMSPALISLCCEVFPQNTATASAAVILSINVAALAGPAIAGKIAMGAGYTTAMLVSAVWLFMAALTVVPVYLGGKKYPEAR